MKYDYGKVQLPFFMVGALNAPTNKITFISVREEHDKTTLSDPLSLSRTEELVNNTLSRVSKVSKLCLPDNQSIRISQRVSELES